MVSRTAQTTNWTESVATTTTDTTDYTELHDRLNGLTEGFDAPARRGLRNGFTTGDHPETRWFSSTHSRSHGSSCRQQAG